MRIRLLTLFLTLFLSNAQGQVNYVLNPSLEQYSTCPYDVGQIRFAKHWSTLDTVSTTSWGRPEYCNTCDTISTSPVKLPSNQDFNDYPRSGKGLAEVLMFVDSNWISGPEQRDYLQGRLYKPLTIGINYCVTFYVIQTQTVTYAVNHIGAYLDNGVVDTCVNTCGLPHPQFIPQVFAVNIISDTLHWIKIEGSFTANGTEKFITIGNFYDLLNTAHVVSNPGSSGGVSYYLVDDVSVIETGTHAHAGNDTTVAVGDSVFLGEIAVPNVWYDGQGSPLHNIISAKIIP